MNLEEFAAFCERKLKGKPVKERAHNSTLAPASKPIKAKGKITERRAEFDAKTKAAVWAREKDCVLCADCGRPEGYIPIHDWAHLHGRKTHYGADVRNDARYSTRLCRVHHQWHGKRLEMYCYDGNTQIFLVDGVEVATREV